MSARNLSANPSRAWLATLFLMAAATLAPGQTLEANSDENPAQPVAFTARPGEIIGREQVIRHFLQCGTNQFMFVSPQNMRDETSKPGTLQLVSSDGHYYLTVRLLGGRAPGSDAKQPSFRKEAALAEFAGAKNVEEFNIAVGGREARGLQLLQNLPNLGERLTRIVWVPSKAGMLEFTLNTDPLKAKLARSALDGVLLTFRSNETGKIEIIPHSDKS